MWLRNLENEGLHLIEPHIAPWTWIKDQNYSNEIAIFINDFEKFFSNEPNIKSYIQEGLKLFALRYEIIKKKNLIRLSKSYVSRFWIWLYKPVKSIIKTLIGANKNLTKSATFLRKFGVKIDQEEVEYITRFLKKH